MIPEISQFDSSIYIDGNVMLNWSNFEPYINSCVDLVCFSNPWWDNVEQEFANLLRLTDPKRRKPLEVNKLWCTPKEVNAAAKLANFDMSCTETNALFRTHTQQMLQFADDWYNQMKISGCHRDQTIFDTALSRHKIQFHKIRRAHRASLIKVRSHGK